MKKKIPLKNQNYCYLTKTLLYELENEDICREIWKNREELKTLLGERIFYFMARPLQKYLLEKSKRSFRCSINETEDGRSSESNLNWSPAMESS